MRQKTEILLEINQRNQKKSKKTIQSNAKFSNPRFPQPQQQQQQLQLHITTTTTTTNNNNNKLNKQNTKI